MADIGVTQRADIVTATQDFSRKNVGRGVFAVANAKNAAENNKQDDLIVQVGKDVFQVSAKQLATKSGPLPAVGETFTLVIEGQELEGVVRYRDDGGTRASKAAGKAVAGVAVGTAAAVGGALLLTKWILDSGH